MALDNKTIQMASGANYAAFTTLFDTGSPQTHVMWVDTDGEHIPVSYTHLTLPTILRV